MREILFRGKTVLGKWIEGDLLQYLVWGKVHIVRNYKGAGGQEVIPETVGQYTGLTDKNGKKIFEGDIVRFPDSEMFPSSEETINEGFVDWDEETMCFYFTNRFSVDMEDFYVDNGKMVDVVVIGNIHDNPELLKGGVQE